MPTDSNVRTVRNADGCLKHQAKRRFTNGDQTETDGANVRVESKRGESENATLSLSTREESSEFLHNLNLVERVRREGLVFHPSLPPFHLAPPSLT